jgi:uncharacterized protein (TIGR02145 family)
MLYITPMIKNLFFTLITIVLATEAFTQEPGTFTDSRNGKTYQTVKIGNQVWMAENLNYPTANGSWCYNNQNSNCVKYGRLYNWQTALKVCPQGWHLPSDTEWQQLIDFAGNNSAVKLKAKSGWNNNGNGTDDYGFSALPGGGLQDYGKFYDLGKDGEWWSSTHAIPGYSWGRLMSHFVSDVIRGTADKNWGQSVRCLKNDQSD